MENFMNKFEEKLGPIAAKLSSNRYLNAIQAGFLVAMPLVVIGSLLLVIALVPIPAISSFFASTGIQGFLLKYNGAATDIIGIFVLAGLVDNLAKTYKLDRIATVAIAISGYLVLTEVSFGSFGSANLFLVMFVGIASTEIVRFVIEKNWTIKMPEAVPEAVSASFTALIPAFVSITVMNIIRAIFALTSFGTAANFINTVVQMPLLKLGGTLPAVLIFIFFEMTLWSFGIHGSNIVGAVFSPIFTALTIENQQAVAAGLTPTNVINAQFYQNFVRLGGAGANLGLALVMFLFARSLRYKQLARLAIGPLAFQVNEPVIFGFPLVMNPIMMIPFIFGPMVIAIICYVAMKTGIVPCTNGANIPWNTPPVVSGFILCGWRGLLLQLVCLGVNALCWLPFFMIEDRKAYKEEQGEI